MNESVRNSGKELSALRRRYHELHNLPVPPASLPNFAVLFSTSLVFLGDLQEQNISKKRKRTATKELRELTAMLKFYLDAAVIYPNLVLSPLDPFTPSTSTILFTKKFYSTHSNVTARIVRVNGNLAQSDLQTSTQTSEEKLATPTIDSIHSRSPGLFSLTFSSPILLCAVRAWQSNDARFWRPRQCAVNAGVKFVSVKTTIKECDDVIAEIVIEAVVP